MQSYASRERGDTSGGASTHNVAVSVVNVTSSLSNIRSWVMSLVDSAISGVKMLISNAKELINNIAAQVNELKGTLTGVINNAIESVQSGFQWLIDESIAFFTGGLQSLRDWVSQVSEDAGCAVHSLREWADTQINDIYISISEAVLAIKAEIKSIMDLLESPEDFFDYLEKVLIAVW